MNMFGTQRAKKEKQKEVMTKTQWHIPNMRKYLRTMNLYIYTHAYTHTTKNLSRYSLNKGIQMTVGDLERLPQH